MTDAEKPPRRWFHLTPDRLVYGLLAGEGLLLAVEPFRWLPKGWPVLIAIACVAAALLFALLWFLASLLFRWRFQFGLRSMFLLALVIAVACGWLSAEMNAAKRRAAALARLYRGAFFDCQFDSRGEPWGFAHLPAPQWLWDTLGGNFFAEIVTIDIEDGGDVTDDDVSRLSEFPELRELDLENSKLTGNELESTFAPPGFARSASTTARSPTAAWRISSVSAASRSCRCE